MTPSKRQGDGRVPGRDPDADRSWDQVPLDGDSGRAGENLPLFDLAPQPEQAPERGRRRGGHHSDAELPEGEGAEQANASTAKPSEGVWVQTSLGTLPEPATPSARSVDGATGAEEPDREVIATPRLGERLLAGLADCVFHLAVVAGGVVAESLLGLRPALGQWPGFLVFLICFSFLYTTLPLAFWGSTPGMAWRGLRARDGGDRPLHFAQTALRWLGALATVALAGLPLLLALGGGSLSDRLSRSRTFAEAV